MVWKLKDKNIPIFGLTRKTDKLYFNIEETSSDSDPFKILDLVDKTKFFGEVTTKESVLENHKSGEE